jgi:hypothetical protein
VFPIENIYSATKIGKLFMVLPTGHPWGQCEWKDTEWSLSSESLFIRKREG